MAKGAWISDEERERIVQMRKDGVAVKDIAKQTERSTNFVYRLLKKVNGDVPNKKKQKTATVSDTAAVSDTAKASDTAAPGANEIRDGRDRLLEDLSDSSAALLCAVEGMEVSAYEPIPMPRSVRSSQQRPAPAQVRPEAVACVTFSAEPGANSSVAKPRAEQSTDEFWLLTDATSSTDRPSTVAQATSGRNQVPSKKRKASSSQGSNGQPPSAATSSALLVTPHLQRAALASPNGVGGLLKRVQDEIRRLETLAPTDIYDAQLLQMLVKFHAEMLLVQLQKTLSAVESNTRARDEDSDGKETSRLLREKLAKKITLLKVQADRERLELEREQIRHKTTSMICRKTLLDANASPVDVDQLFPRQ